MRLKPFVWFFLWLQKQKKLEISRKFYCPKIKKISYQNLKWKKVKGSFDFRWLTSSRAKMKVKSNEQWCQILQNLYAIPMKQITHKWQKLKNSKNSLPLFAFSSPLSSVCCLLDGANNWNIFFLKKDALLNAIFCLANKLFLRLEAVLARIQTHYAS